VSTGLRAGTAVFVGCIDCEAEAIGGGVNRPGDVSVVAGTWSINQTYVAKPPRRRRHFLVNPAAQPGMWLVLEGSPCSAANFDWVVRTVGDGLTPTRAVIEAASAGRSGLLFIPHVPTGAGAFVRLSSAHQRGHLIRAVMEGVVFAHRAHLEKLQASIGRIKRVTLSGGAAASRFWCQLFADGLGCKVEVPRGDQLGALGAAICAGVGAGLWPDIPAAQKAMVPGKRVFSPNLNQHAALRRDYARYRRQIRLLVP
jgi:L-xylulokinase